MWKQKSNEEKRIQALYQPSDSLFDFDALNEMVQKLIEWAKDEQNFWVVVGSTTIAIVLPILLIVLKPTKTKANANKKNQKEKSQAEQKYYEEGENNE